MFWIPPFWPSSIKTTQTGLHPEDVAGPVAIVGCQEPPLEEGVMSGNHSHHNRLSPDYWAPPPVSTHQEHYFNALLPSSHRLVSNIDCVMCLTHLPLSFSQLFLSSDLRSSPDSAALVLLHLHADTSTGSPGDREKDVSRSDKNIALCHSLRSHLDSLPCFNPLHTFNKPPVVNTYLPVSCVSADRNSLAYTCLGGSWNGKV